MYKQDDLICVLGPRESGKSYLTRRISVAQARLVIFDTAHEYTIEEDDLSATNPAELGRLAKLILEYKPKSYRLIYRWDPERVDDEDPMALANELNRCLRILYHLGNCHIVIEELPQYTNARGMPSWLRKLVLIGRHRGIGITATTQRPAEIPKTFISNCRHVFFSRFDEANDLKYFAETLGKTAINSMRSLKQFYFIHYERPGKTSVLKA